MLMFRIVVAAFLLAALAPPSTADVTGQATVIDGDTIVVAGERVRLEGIDAPELHQTCTAYGQQWACGRTSAEWLREHLNGRQVECVGHARDRYGRLLAVCYVGGGSINKRIVREGWALDYRKYSTDYLQAESAAKRDGAGPPATDVLLHLTVPCAGGAPEPGRMACRMPGHLTGDLLSLDARRDGPEWHRASD